MKVEPEQSGIVRIGMVFMGALMILAAPFAAFIGVTKFLEAKASTKWPQAQGVITGSAVRSAAKGHETIYTPDVQYEFSVDGRVYRGSRVTASDSGTKHEENAQAIAARHPAGAQRPVSYNPADPSESFLEPGVSMKSWLFLALPLILVGFGGLFIYAAWTSRPKKAAAQPKW